MCVGCPKGWKCHLKVWGKCVCKLPKWNHCCKRIVNPVCASKNALCAVLKKAAYVVLRGAETIVRKSKVFLDVAKGGLSLAHGVVNSAKGLLDLAVKALDVVRATYRVGVSALNAVAKFTLTKIIDIKEMYFKVQLSLASGGKFQCQVKGVLVGKHINLNLNFDINDILKIAKSLGEKVVAGLSNFFG